MKRLIAGIVLIIVIVAALVAPYVIGMRAQTLFHQHVERLSARINQPIQIVRYDRGWFSSQAVTRISLPNHNTLTLHHDIAHGPYSVFGWAEVTTTLELHGKPAINYYFGDQPVVTLTTRFGYDGSVYMHALSPGFSKPARDNKHVAITWGGAEASVRLEGSRVHYAIELPKLAVDTPDGSLTMTGMLLKGTGNTLSAFSRESGEINWQSQALIRIEQIALRGDDGKYAQASLSWHFESGLGETGQYRVDSRLTISDAAFRTAKGPRTKPFRIEKALLHIALKGINTDALVQLRKDLRALSRQVRNAPAKAGDQIIATLLSYLPKLLTRNTALIAEIPTYKSNHGTLGLHAVATLGPPRPGADVLPAAIKLLRRLNVNVRAFVSKKLLRTLVGQKPKLVKYLTSHQWLLLQNGRYTLRIHYGPQRFSINGQPASRMLRGFFAPG